MTGETATILLISLIAVLLAVVVISLYLYLKKTSENLRLKNEIEKLTRNVDEIVRERTRQLEVIKDSVSGYAVQKYEIAQELELKNREILRQKDDILKQAEKLRQAYDEIKKLDAFKHQMTRMIIHDLKNPLNVLLNAINTFQIPEKPAAVIRQITYEMLDLVMNILDVNKFEDSKMKIRYANIDLAEVVKKLLQKFSYVSEQSGIDLQSYIPEPCMINTDQQVIERVIENLLSNAVKFTPPGGKIQVVAIDQVDKIKIEVRDNGSGIPESIINSIFEEYVQDSEKAVVYKNSTGIGLTYCKLAIEAQGGEIGLLSKKDEGTTVWFITQKAESKPLSGTAIPENISTPSNYKPDLSREEIELIRPLIDQIKITGIYEVSSIIQILNDEKLNSGKALQIWKSAVETAVFNANTKMFSELTNL